MVPNHFITLEDNASAEDWKNKLKECVDGSHGKKAAEVKCAIIAFHEVPPGMCHYYPLSGYPQSINESNIFMDNVVKACLIAAEELGNVIVLNTSTDGVACEVQRKLNLSKKYMLGESNQISLSDHNHNVKNLRYQLICGSYPASIGYFVSGPYMLLKAGV